MSLLLRNLHNYFIRDSPLFSNAKNFYILATSTFYIIILIIQQNYFSDLYPAKILDLSGKSFFSYRKDHFYQRYNFFYYIPIAVFIKNFNRKVQEVKIYERILVSCSEKRDWYAPPIYLVLLRTLPFISIQLSPLGAFERPWNSSR